MKNYVDFLVRNMTGYKTSPTSRPYEAARGGEVFQPSPWKTSPGEFKLNDQFYEILDFRSIKLKFKLATQSVVLATELFILSTI